MIWIHTEIVSTLGPLEYILNTPSHHRVHHGRNPKYIDKNFGGVLIIWDRLFGTFQQEDEEEPVAYGLVHSIESYNTWHIQFHHILSIGKRLFNAENFSEKVSVLFKGPGWSKGSPRLGNIEDIPKVSTICLNKMMK